MSTCNLDNVCIMTAGLQLQIIAIIIITQLERNPPAMHVWSNIDVNNVKYIGWFRNLVYILPKLMSTLDLIFSDILSHDLRIGDVHVFLSFFPCIYNY